MTSETHKGPEQLHVVIAGGGVAALETMMALRAHATTRVAMTIVSPETSFSYRPLSVQEPFAHGPPQEVPLGEVAREFEAGFRQDALAAVDQMRESVTLASGEQLSYDALVLAMGARRIPALSHALTFRGQEDSETLHGLIQDLEGGYLKRIAFVVPAGVTWSLPIYELALMTAERASGMNLMETELTLVTPEEQPLAIFGPEASAAVTKLLDHAGIAVVCSASAETPGQGRLVMHPGGRELECDRVVALAAVVGIELPGIPSDGDGFVPVDTHGRVTGAKNVYAAGDGTDFPIKQGGIACQQADAVAESLAERVGALENPEPFQPVLRGQLLTGARPEYLRADISGRNGDASAASEEPLWWPPGKVAGVYLGPYLEARRTGVGRDAADREVRDPVLMVPASAGGNTLEILGFPRASLGEP